MKNINYGLVLTCLGGPFQNLSYKESRLGNSNFDKFLQQNKKVNYREFTPIGGSNERHFCFPTVDFPVGQFARTIYQKYSEYHTSLDDIEFANVENIQNSGLEIFKIIKEYEKISNIKQKPAKLERKKYGNNNQMLSQATSKYGEPFYQNMTYTQNKILTVLRVN